MTIDCFVIHHAANTSRRRYLENSALPATVQPRFVSDYPPERIESELPGIYSFDANEWLRHIDRIHRVLLGYAIGQKDARLPWPYCFMMAERMFPDLSIALRRAPWLRPRSLTVSELSCYLKHLSTWRRIAHGGLGFALVVEDDIVIRPDSLGFLREMVSALPSRWDLIDIVGGESLTPRGGCAVVNRFFYAVDPPRDRTTCGYLVTGDFCRRLVALLTRPVFPVDWELTRAMTELKARVFWTYPSVFEHGSKIGTYPETVTRAATT